MLVCAAVQSIELPVPPLPLVAVVELVEPEVAVVLVPLPLAPLPLAPEPLSLLEELLSPLQPAAATNTATTTQPKFRKATMQVEYRNIGACLAKMHQNRALAEP